MHFPMLFTLFLINVWYNKQKLTAIDIIFFLFTKKCLAVYSIHFDMYGFVNKNSNFKQLCKSLVGVRAGKQNIQYL